MDNPKPTSRKQNDVSFGRRRTRAFNHVIVHVQSRTRFSQGLRRGKRLSRRYQVCGASRARRPRETGSRARPRHVQAFSCFGPARISSRIIIITITRFGGP